MALSIAHYLAFVALILEATPGCRQDMILAGYGSKMPPFPDQCEGGQHPGVDFRAQPGTRVLASANGVVISVRTTKAGGGVLLLWHEGFDRYTAYVHLNWPQRPPEIGEQILRGQTIGRVGVFRNSGSAPHVHLELCTTPCVWGHPSCYLDGTEDPLQSTGECYDEGARYSEGRLILTYPVPC